MKKIFLNIGIGILFISIITGCNSTKYYDILPPLPEYPETKVDFDTSATIDFYEDSNNGLNQEIYRQLKANGYTNVLKKIRFCGHDLSSTRVLQLLHVMYMYYNCRDGRYLETRVIIMVRNPGEVWNKKLQYSKPRYFQAFSRFKLGDSEIYSEKALGFSMAVKNLFRIEEFRRALEPVKVPEMLNSDVVSADILWQQSVAFQRNQSTSDAIFRAYLAADRGHREASRYLLDQVMSSSILRPLQLVRMIKKGAEYGNPKAQNKLGMMHLNGEIVVKENYLAYHWFRRAAEQNFPEGLLNLGFCYEHGIGVTKDTEKAISLYRAALKLGSQTAKYRLKHLIGK